MQIRDTRRNEATPVQEESRTNPEPDSGIDVNVQQIVSLYFALFVRFRGGSSAKQEGS